MRIRLTVFATAMIMLATVMQPCAFASDNASVATSSQMSTTNDPEAKEESAKASGDLAVDNIQDIAYTLQRIRQQAINIYIESTRKPVKHYELNIISLSTMPTTSLESQSVYLPLRKAWLAFFIGTMEPLVQILNEHVKHLKERTEQKHLPSECLPEWQGIISEWKNTIKQLNEQLDTCAALLDNCAPENVEVAKSARAIDDQISQLDSILQRGSKFLQHNLP